MMVMQVVNISAYKFVALPVASLPEWKARFVEAGQQIQIKGTILLSTEGINLFIAGSREQIDRFGACVKAIPEFADLWFKESYSEEVPFKRFRVKLKKEIISFRDQATDPLQQTADYIRPVELKRWFEENRPMLVLDTRNQYEVGLGKFQSAVDFNIAHFEDFKDAAANKLPQIAADKNLPIVTYCTGGVRCEKAALYLNQLGFKNVYQLEGGILNYFEKVGAEHYQGSCFVFDERVALEPKDVTR